MVEAEFDAIWAAQSGWNPVLSSAMRESLRRIIFHQRPLKVPPVGRCWLEAGIERTFRAMPTAQAYRIAQDLAHLRLRQPGMPERALTDEERSILRSQLLRGRDLTFDQVRKRLGLPSETDFNLASIRRQELLGSETAHRLGSKKVFGEAWHALPLARQDEAVVALLRSDTDEQAEAALVAIGLDPAAATRATGISLPDGTASLSLQAMRRILPHLDAGLRYDEAVKAAGYAHHSDQRTGEVRDRLPYYGEVLFDRIGTGTGKAEDGMEKRWGRAPNPTVHVALNEIRRVVNAIIDKHGPPAEIVVETLRDLGRSAVQRREAEREQKTNQDANARRRRELLAMGLPANGRNLTRLRLWEEQASDPKLRMCPYTGAIITVRMALSDEVEEDHILPFAVSLDDSTANRVLVTREANRRKARRTPFEAFGHTPEWPAILENIRVLPANKRWRFAPDAMTRLNAEGDFLARHLNDSSNIARLARMYLDVLAPGKVWSTPGRLTALLRAKLGLNSDRVLGKGGPYKDRTDHRHHAIDAVVVGLTDRGLLQKVSAAARRSEEAQERLLGRLGEPWPGFVADVARAVAGIVVSYKPDAAWQGALHNDTAYGPLHAVGRGDPNVVVRRSLEALADWSAQDARDGVRDPVLSSKIAEVLGLPDKSARKAGLLALTHSGGHRVRRIRTVERLNNTTTIRDRRTGNPYKVVKLDSNHRADLWRLPDGKAVLKVVSTFDAARDAMARAQGDRPPKDLRPHPAARLLFRLHKNDVLAEGVGEGRRFLRVVKMRDGEVTLAPHNEAGNLKARDANADDIFRYVTVRAARLVEIGARKVWVDAAGRIRDPGPPR